MFVLWFMSTSVGKQFGLETETFGKILFLFVSSASGDRLNHSHRFQSQRANKIHELKCHRISSSLL